MAIVDFTKSARTDTTLVQAAQGAAMAGVPKDLTKIFDGIADHYERGMTQLGAGLAKAAEVAVEAGGMLGEKMMERKKRRDAGENINDGFTEQFTGQLDFIKDIRNNAGVKSFVDGEDNVLEFTAPNGDVVKFDNKKDARRYAKKMEDNLYSSVAQAGKAFDGIEEMVMNKQIDIQMSGPDMLNFATVLSRGGGEVTDKNGNVIGSADVGFDKDGFTIFSFKDENGEIKKNKHGQPIVGTRDEIEKMLVIKNPKAVETANKFSDSLYSVGKAGGNWEDNKNAVVTNIENLCADQNTLLSMMSQKFGNEKQSFHDALHNPSVISAEMFSLFSDKYEFPVETHDVSGPKGEPDGVVDESDFVANAEKFIGVITDQTNPQFDLLKSRSVFANWYADNPAKTKFNQGKNVFNVAKNKKNQTTTKLPSQQKFNQNENSYYINDEGDRVKQTIAGQQMKNIAQRLEGGSFNDWNQQEDGSWSDGETTMSGTQMLEKIGQDYDFNFLEDARFAPFKNDVGQSVEQGPNLFDGLDFNEMDDDDMAAYINENFGDVVQAKAPINPFREKITVDGKDFFIGGSKGTDPEAEKKRLINYLQQKKRSSNLPG